MNATEWFYLENNNYEDSNSLARWTNISLIVAVMGSLPFVPHNFGSVIYCPKNDKKVYTMNFTNHFYFYQVIPAYTSDTAVTYM